MRLWLTPREFGWEFEYSREMKRKRTFSYEYFERAFL
jgi:hypothetical protein